MKVNNVKHGLLYCRTRVSSYETKFMFTIFAKLCHHEFVFQPVELKNKDVRLVFANVPSNKNDDVKSHLKRFSFSFFPY